MRTIYVLSLVTVAKINPHILTKGRAIECLLHARVINTDVCVEFYEILNNLSASKPPEEILRFDTLPWQQYFRYQYSLHSFTSAVFFQYSDEV